LKLALITLRSPTRLLLRTSVLHGVPARRSGSARSQQSSSGGGIIGAGEHDAVRAASETLLSTAEAHLGDLAAAVVMPLPEVGRVRFCVRTFKGIMGAEASEEDLGEGRHTLSPLFHTAHAVIAAVWESTPP
jgi:hypothetical protein